MIISEDRGFAFLHIPKNAGTSVRRQLEPFDTTDGTFRNPIEHPALGRLYGTHVPLTVLREHFGETFEKLRGLRTFAVVREPRARFRSALAQLLREKHQVELAHADQDLVDREANQVAEGLSAAGDMPSRELTHFIPQHRWIEVDGELFTDELFLMSDVAGLFAAISAHIGEQVGEPAKANETVSHRFPGLIGAARKANRQLQNALPSGAHKFLVDVAKPILTRRPAVADEQVPGGEALDAFLSEHYAKDFAIFDALQTAKN